MMTGIYVRVSTEEQVREGFSIRGQEEKLRSYSAIKNWTVHKVYADEGISGKNIEARPALNELLDDVRKKKIENVLIYKVDRLTRSTKNLIELVEFFNVEHCAFNSLQESIDTESATGRMFLKIIGIFAEFERENLIERVRFGIERKFQEGYNIGYGSPSLGYDRTNGDRIQRIAEDEAEIVRRIYDMYLADDMTITEIARTLNDEGVPTKKNGAWEFRTVKLILTNANYIGMVRHNVTNKEEYQEKEGKHLPIIDKVTFYEVQEKIRRMTKTYRTKRPKDDVYFTGIARCPLCGSKLSPKRATKTIKSGKTYEYLGYRCSSVLTNRCSFSCGHKAIQEAFEDYLLTIEDISEPLTGEQEKIDDIVEQQSRIQAEIDELKARRDDIATEYVNKSIGFEDYKILTEKFRDSITALENQLNRYKNLDVAIQIDSKQTIRKVRDNWDYLNDNEKRYFISKFIESINIDVVSPKGKLPIKCSVADVTFIN